MHDTVIEPWQPQEGDYVRVERNPECRAWHSIRSDESVAYGRVEIVDRDYPNSERWVEEIAGTKCGNEIVTEDEARANAGVHRGHYYLVQDALGSGRIAMLDGWYCAFELTPVSRVEALIGIAKARAERDRLTPDQRLRRMLFGVTP